MMITVKNRIPSKVNSVSNLAIGYWFSTKLYSLPALSRSRISVNNFSWAGITAGSMGFSCSLFLAFLNNLIIINITNATMTKSVTC